MDDTEKDKMLWTPSRVSFTDNEGRVLYMVIFLIPYLLPRMSLTNVLFEWDSVHEAQNLISLPYLKSALFFMGFICCSYLSFRCCSLSLFFFVWFMQYHCLSFWHTILNIPFCFCCFSRMVFYISTQPNPYSIWVLFDKRK